MSIYVSEPQGAYDTIPGGTYAAVCYLVADIGEHWQNPMEAGKEGRWQRQVILGWEVQGVEIEGETPDEDKVYTIHKFYSATLGKNSNLRADLEKWRGKTFTDEELKGFDLCNVLGVPSLIQVGAKKKQNGEVKEGVVLGLMRLPRTMTYSPATQQIEFSIERDMDKLDEMPKLVQTCVKNSRQYKEADVSASEDRPFMDDDPFGDNDAPGVDPFAGDPMFN